METTTNSPRTPAQTAASKANGARSAGPITPTGKAIASANGTTHALAARGVLLPSERAEDYEANLQAWFVTLLPRTPGEGLLAARVADVGFRMHRLSRLEERLVNAALEKRLAGSPGAKALQTAQEALQAIRSVAALAEEVETPRPAQAVAQIASGLRFVADLLTKTDIPIAVAAGFELAVTALVADAEGEGDVAPEMFQALGHAARKAEAALMAKVTELETSLAAEREKLADSVLLGDDADATLLDRHRSRLSRELGAHLGNLKLLRELAAPARDGERQEPIPVELRLVGRGGGR